MTTKLQTELDNLETELSTPTPAQKRQKRQNPPFPVESLPPVMRSIVEESANATRVPDSLSAMVALACVGTSIGGGISIESTNGRTLNGNLHILAVAKSGTGKGSVYGMVAAPLTTYNGELIEEWRTQTLPELLYEQAILADKMKKERGMISKGEGSTDEYRQMVKDLASIEEQMKLPPKLLVGETTEQALGMALAGQPHEAVGNFNPEARGLVQIILGKFGSGNDSTGETLYCAGYSGDPYSIERTGRPDINLKNPCLSVLFMLQPDSMKKLTTSDSMTVSGFLPRFLMADVKADFQEDTGEDLSLSHDTVESWAELINDLLDFYRESKDKMTVKVTSGAAELLRKESNRVGSLGREGASHDRFSIYVFRYGENLRRLHLVLHVATHGAKSHTIEADEETARNAIAISQWFFNESMSLLKNGQTERIQKQFERIVKIIKKVKSDGKSKGITVRDMVRLHSITERDIEEVQEAFPDTLEMSEIKTGGRPSTILTII